MRELLLEVMELVRALVLNLVALGVNATAPSGRNERIAATATAAGENFMLGLLEWMEWWSKLISNML